MTTQTKSRGFTIVELLIVIVIIAILAAITIVAYNGITNRANQSSAKAAANSAIKKIEAYNADDKGGNGSYPTTTSTLTGAAATTTYQLTGVSFTTNATNPTVAPASTTPADGGPSRLKFYTCTNGSAVAYWDYTSSATDKWTQVFTGGGTSATCTYAAAS